MSIVVKRSSISATAEHVLIFYYTVCMALRLRQIELSAKRVNDTILVSLETGNEIVSVFRDTMNGV